MTRRDIVPSPARVSFSSVVWMVILLYVSRSSLLSSAQIRTSSRSPHIRNPHSAGSVPADTMGMSVDCAPNTVAGPCDGRITYTCGKFGIDDQGSVRFLLRFASDAGRPQFDRPGAPNYCTATASNGSTLLLEYHPRGAFRPWFKAIRVNVMRDALREGDTITLVLGDRSQGGAGWRTSTMREQRFELHRSRNLRLRRLRRRRRQLGDRAAARAHAVWKLVVPNALRRAASRSSCACAPTSMRQPVRVH